MTHLRRATIVAASFLAARPLIKAALLEVATLSKLPNADAMQSGALRGGLRTLHYLLPA